ncbi:MAG: hypothetical protein ACMUIM_04105 [bacterium]
MSGEGYSACPIETLILSAVIGNYRRFQGIKDLSRDIRVKSGVMERRKIRGHKILPVGIILLMMLLSGFYSIGMVRALLYSSPEPPSRITIDYLNLLSPPIGLYPPMSPADPGAYN